MSMCAGGQEGSGYVVVAYFKMRSQTLRRSWWSSFVRAWWASKRGVGRQLLVGLLCGRA